MDEDDPIKVVLLGETAVGKSCLITRFVNDAFQSKTVFYDKLNKQIKYEIWDTAGQEKYRSLNKMFYNNADFVILVVDITRKETFEAIKDFWYNEVKDNSPENVILALAANKCDLYEYEEVSTEELQEYAQSINAIYKQTSALQNTGINDLFDYIGYKILAPDNYKEFIRKSNSKKTIKIDNLSSSDKKSKGSNRTVGKKKGCC